MADSESQETIIDFEDDSDNVNSPKPLKRTRTKNSRTSNKKLNDSGFRRLALSSKYIKSVSPHSIVLIKEFTDKYIILPIINDNIRTRMNTLDGRTNNKSKAYRIFNVDKLKQIAHKYVRYDVYNSTIRTQVAFHPQSFRNYVNDKTNEILLHENNFIKLQWSSSCIELFQQIVENELHLLLRICGDTMSYNNKETNKSYEKLRLMPKDIRMVFNARYVTK
jgi:hypothetical protein